MEQAPLQLTIELVRSRGGADPYRFDFTAQPYKRRAGTAYREAELPWSPELLRALQELSSAGRRSEAAQYLGDLLRSFLAPLGWEADEQQLNQALEQGREVHLILRFAAAELYALPWELITLANSRRHLGASQGVHVRYEVPRNEERFRAASAPPAEGRLLLAWSAEGGSVPFAEHLAAIQAACRSAPHPFEARDDVLPHVSLSTLRRALKESPRRVTALHLLCHGARREQTFGLCWSPASPGGEAEFVDATTLREVLAPYSESLRLVVLCACASGDAGAFGSHLGSVAQALHALGIRAVVASRLPLSSEGSILLTRTLYQDLLVEHRSLQHTLASSREELKSLGATTMDWATVQLYARQDEPAHQFPFVFRPYQGLLSFEGDRRAFFFGRGDQTRAWVERVREADRGERPRLQLLVGPSGIGKSSLARAAILPALADGGWEVVSRRAAEAGLLEEIQRFRARPPPRSRLLLIDQFEEIFSRPAQEREPIARALWELSRSAEPRTVVLLALRLDALERCAGLRLDEAGTSLLEVALDPGHHAFLHPPGAEQYREATVEPARRAGLSFEPGLVEQLVRDAGLEPGALPLLEYTLDLLWERRERDTLTQAAYHQLGGLTGALARTIGHLHEKLSPAEQRQMRRLLVELVDFRDEPALATRRREALANMRPADPTARETFDALVERLVSQRLVVRSEGPGGDTTGGWIELAHEALIRRWDTLGQWLREDADRVLAVRTVREWAREWRSHRGEPDGGAGYLPAGGRLAFLREVRGKYQEDLRGPAETELVEAAEAADRERDARFLDTVRIANRLLIEIRSLAEVPGMDLRRKSLLEQVGRMLDNLIESSGSRVIALRARAVACREQGDVALSLGHWDVAQAQYEEGMRLSREVYELVKPDPVALDGLATSHDKLATLAERRHDFALASEHFASALRLTEQLAEEQPPRARIRLDLAHALRRMASCRRKAGENLDVVQGLLERAHELLASGSDHPKLKPQMAFYLWELGTLHADKEEPASAEKHFQAALEILSGLPEPQASEPQVRQQVAGLYSDLGLSALHRHDVAEAHRRYLNAHHLLEALLEKDPRNVALQEQYALSLYDLGTIDAARGALDEARADLAEARDRLESLVKRVPAAVSARITLLRSVLALGNLAGALEDRSALEGHRRSAEGLLAALEHTSASPTSLRLLREELHQLLRP